MEARVVLCTLIRKYKWTKASAENGKKHTKAIPIAPADVCTSRWREGDRAYCSR